MRNYAQGWRSDCDDLIEQKPQCVRLHMRIFVNEDHRKMNVRPQRKFASSRVTGIDSWQVKQGVLNGEAWATWENKHWSKLTSVVSGEKVLFKNDQQSLEVNFAPTQITWQSLANKAWQCQVHLTDIEINKTFALHEPVEFLYQQTADATKQIQFAQLDFSLLHKLIKQWPDFPKDKL